MERDQSLAITYILKIAQALTNVGFSFSDAKDIASEQGYTTYGTLETKSSLIVVRVSNHICSMKNWTERYKSVLVPNKKLARRMGNNVQTQYKKRVFFSLVFKTFDYSPNDSGGWKATCAEYVFDPLAVENNGLIDKIANDAYKLRNGGIISICGINPSIRETRNNENINKLNMKNLIKLTESDLHRIVKESVNSILTELDWKTYQSAADKRDKQADNYHLSNWHNSNDDYETIKRKSDEEIGKLMKLNRSACDLSNAAYYRFNKDHGYCNKVGDKWNQVNMDGNMKPNGSIYGDPKLNYWGDPILDRKLIQTHNRRDRQSVSPSLRLHGGRT